MKHKTWFKLVLKAIGVFLLATGLSDFVGYLAQVINVALDSPGMFEWRWFLWGLAANPLRIAFGLYLLFWGKALVNLCIPSNRPYCPECGYDVSKCDGVVCPECGEAMPPVPASRRRTERPEQRVESTGPIHVPRKVGSGAQVRFDEPVEITEDLYSTRFRVRQPKQTPSPEWRAMENVTMS